MATGPILVPVDFSDDARAALIWACETASCMDAAVVVLHVVHEAADETGRYRRSDSDDTLKPLDVLAAEMLSRFIGEMKAAHPDLGPLDAIETRIVDGVPVPRILEVAEDTDARMIVMGSRGLTGLDRFLLGSKAEEVVRRAPVPVTIVKEEGAEA